MKETKDVTKINGVFRKTHMARPMDALYVTSSMEQSPYQENNSSYGRLCRSQLSRDLGPRSTAARLLRLWVRIPPGDMKVCLL